MVTVTWDDNRKVFNALDRVDGSLAKYRSINLFVETRILAIHYFFKNIQFDL